MNSWKFVTEECRSTEGGRKGGWGGGRECNEERVRWGQSGREREEDEKGEREEREKERASEQEEAREKSREVEREGER